jgi:hypothetical protein
VGGDEPRAEPKIDVTHLKGMKEQNKKKLELVEVER